MDVQDSSKSGASVALAPRLRRPAGAGKTRVTYKAPRTLQCVLTLTSPPAACKVQSSPHKTFCESACALRRAVAKKCCPSVALLVA